MDDILLSTQCKIKRVFRWLQERVRQRIMDKTLRVSNSVMCPGLCQRPSTIVCQTHLSGSIGLRSHTSGLKISPVSNIMSEPRCVQPLDMSSTSKMLASVCGKLKSL
eukprot:3845534-Karenia_brevis.AAC.1